ncbi:MAG: hypothetical protein ACRC9U_00030 [Metamycoplasmataceae bacterium]
MSLNIYIGKNKTGKSKKLKEIFDEDKEKTIFFESEIDPDVLIQKETNGTGKEAIVTPQNQLKKLINKLFEIEYTGKIEWANEIKKEYNESCEIVKNMISKLKEISKNDDFVEKEIVKSFQIKNQKEEEHYWNISPINDFLNWEFNKKTILDFSSGTKFYSMILIVINILKNLIEKNDDKLKNEIKNWKIIIDEPEKFCHPELISKIGSSIYDLSKIIEITIATHSPFLIESIVKKNEFDTDNSNNNIKYYYCYREKKQINEEQKEELNRIELKNLSSILKDENYRRQRIIISCLFSSNIIFYEGINDETFLYSLINKLDSEKHVSFFDTNDKKGVKACFNLLKELGLSEILNIALFYDKDNDKEEPVGAKYEIVQDKNLEEYFFGETYNQKRKAKKDKNENEKDKEFSFFKIKKENDEIAYLTKGDIDVKYDSILIYSTVDEIEDKLNYKKAEIKEWLFSKDDKNIKEK